MSTLKPRHMIAAVWGNFGMASRQRHKRSLAAWLGLLGLAAQAWLPMLLAAEIGQQSFDPATQALCLHNPADAPQPPARQDHLASCTICISLAASAVFTAPTPVALPLPRLVGKDSFPSVEIAAAAPNTVVSYRSRAPPQLG